MPLLQQDRLVSISTPLGADVLLVETLEGTEAMSSPFRFQLVLVSEKRDLKLTDLVGQRVTINFELAGGKVRHVNGYVCRFSQGDVDSRVSHYYAEVVPWLWFLTRTTDSRIFQKKNVPDIVQQVFKDLGFNDFKFQLQGTFEPREYVVQYRETDFNFVSRLLEEEGIGYWFEHTADKHTLILSNDPGAHQPCPNQAKARYAYLMGGNQDPDVITRWHLEQEVQPGKVTLRDYHFLMPPDRQEVSVPTAVKIPGNDKLEIYDYPGGYAKRFDGEDKTGKVRPDGERTAKLEMQGEEAFHKTVSGAGSCRAFVPGYKFELAEHRRADFNGSYVITQVSHAATNNLGGGEGATYDNTFSCIPLAVPFRPARVAMKPFVHGAQTAVVVGTPGEEIDTDKHGRIKVQFHWDREGKYDQNSSCWIRVGTPWAGKQWGMVHIPRIGQEVIVHFLEGDPDQPLVIGSVYNAEQMPPYTLPENKTQSGIKSRSSLGGTDQNFNEIRFEDKKGVELLTIHAEKNQEIGVENDETHWVGHNRAKTIENDEITHVKHDRTETVDNNETITIHGNRTETVDKDENITIKQNRTESVTKDERIRVNGKRSEEVGKSESVSVGENRDHAVGKNDTLSVGKVLLVTAGDQITLKTGDASIVMKKNGDIVIKGKNIKLETSAKVDVKASGDVTIKGSKIAQN